jgi:hypothetical protein
MTRLSSSDLSSFELLRCRSLPSSQKDSLYSLAFDLGVLAFPVPGVDSRAFTPAQQTLISIYIGLSELKGGGRRKGEVAPVREAITHYKAP